MNLRSQRGATGADIMIAISVIVLSVAVVSMIYVNTTLQSRNVTRTAGATRIATNILENIEKLSYVDFIAEYNSSNWVLVPEGKAYAGYKEATNVTTFNTKIPKGFTVYLFAEPSYGSYSGTGDADKQFDLVRDIRLVVSFSVGDVNRIVDFRTSKNREIANEVNAPDLAVLAIQNITNATSKYYPVKYSTDANAYIRTTVDDEEWYNYSNKKWAMVIVSTKSETELFDVNGKIKSGATYTKYVWIPKYFTNSGETAITEFAYLASTTQAIKAKQELKAKDETTILYYNAIAPKASTSKDPTTASFVVNNQNVSGKWIQATNVSSDAVASLLQNSSYGPCELH